VCIAKKGAKRTHCVTDPAADSLYNVLVRSFGIKIPLPSILKSLKLRTGFGAILFGEKDVVILPRIKRRIEIDQVNRVGCDITLQDLAVVPVVESVGHQLGRACYL